MKIIKPRSEDQTNPQENKRVFLAGSIDMGMAEDWQTRAAQALSDLPVTIYNPRRDNWDAGMVQDITNPEFAYQVNWELNKIDAADVVFFYFSPGGPAPITLMELGHAAHHKTAVVCCPEGYWRRGNVQIMCQRSGIPFFNDLDEAIDALRKALR